LLGPFPQFVVFIVSIIPFFLGQLMLAIMLIIFTLIGLLLKELSGVNNLLVGLL